MHKISQAYLVLAYGKPFITELFELSSYSYITNKAHNKPITKMRHSLFLSYF